MGELALEHVGHVHDLVGAVAADGSLDDAHVRRGRVEDADRVGEVLVELAEVGALVIEQVGVGVVVEGQVQAVEHLAGLEEPHHRYGREDLAVEQAPVRVDLGAERAHVVDLVGDGLEHPAQRAVAPPRACHEAHAPLRERADEGERLLGNARVVVEQGSVHVGRDEFDHGPLPSRVRA